jgi:hypothetical protein
MCREMRDDYIRILEIYVSWIEECSGNLISLIQPNCRGFFRILIVAAIFCNYWAFSFRQIKLQSVFSASKYTTIDVTSLYSMVKIIDSHVHVWSDGAMPFAYSGTVNDVPPVALKK